MGLCISYIREWFLDRTKREPPLDLVTLDRKYKGEKVSVTSFVIIGEGIALANAALHQSRAYWEIKVLDATGNFCVGVSHRLKADHLNQHLGQNSRHNWGLRFDKESGLKAKAGDIISVMLDQSEVPILNFSLNGVRLEKSIRGIRGLVFPAMSVSNGARLDANFGPSIFTHTPPRGFSGIIRAQDLL